MPRPRKTGAQYSTIRVNAQDADYIAVLAQQQRRTRDQVIAMLVSHWHTTEQAKREEG